MTDLANIMNWCNENCATFEIKDNPCLKNGLTTYNCKITIFFDYDYRAIFTFKANIKGGTSNKCVYRLYNDNDKYMVQYMFDDFGVDLLDIVCEKIKENLDDFEFGFMDFE